MLEKNKTIGSLNEQLELIKVERKTIRAELVAALANADKLKQDTVTLEYEVQEARTQFTQEADQSRLLRAQNDRDSYEIQQLYAKQNDLQALVNLLRTSNLQFGVALVLTSINAADQESRLNKTTQDYADKSQAYEELKTTFDVMKDSLDDAVKSRDEMIAERNFFKRKAESLSVDMEKMLRNQHALSRPAIRSMSQSSDPKAFVIPASTPRASAPVSAEMQRMIKSEAELKSTLEFYRKALEEQIIRRKQEEQRQALDAERSDSQMQRQNKYVFLPLSY